jgi:hypothetical protein
MHDSIFVYDEPAAELRKRELLAGIFAIMGSRSTILTHIDESHRGQGTHGRIDQALLVSLLQSEQRQEGWLAVFTRDVIELLKSLSTKDPKSQDYNTTLKLVIGTITTIESVLGWFFASEIESTLVIFNLIDICTVGNDSVIDVSKHIIYPYTITPDENSFSLTLQCIQPAVSALGTFFARDLSGVHEQSHIANIIETLFAQGYLEKLIQLWATCHGRTSVEAIDRFQQSVELDEEQYILAKKVSSVSLYTYSLNLCHFVEDMQN